MFSNILGEENHFEKEVQVEKQKSENKRRKKKGKSSCFELRKEMEEKKKNLTQK